MPEAGLQVTSRSREASESWTVTRFQRVRWAVLSIAMLPLGLTALGQAIRFMPQALDMRADYEEKGLMWVGLFAWVGNVTLLVAARSTFLLARGASTTARRRAMLGVVACLLIALAVVDIGLLWTEAHDRRPLQHQAVAWQPD